MTHLETQEPTGEGIFMHDLARRLWPIHRSITGDGVRQTLAILREYLPALMIHEVPSGTQVFDWKIPQEWTVRRAYLEGPSGDVIVDVKDNNLHVVGYSVGVDEHLSLQDLQPHLHSIPEQPTAIPFVTSYYHPNWGFCLTQEQRNGLEPGTYHAVIDTEHVAGSLTYGELLIPGEVEDEIFLSTYICHPSMANNELSGPVVATALARWIEALPKRHYSYRIVFVPESIGAITYTSLHLKELKDRVIAGFQLTCIGDERAFTYLATRHGNTRIDRVAKRVLRSRENVREYSYLHRGSDERTYCSAGLDLPVVSIMRSRYGDYPEYHTSLDDLESVVTPTGLQGGFDAVRECIETLETEKVLITSNYGEPQLGPRGLYHSMLNKNTSNEVMMRTNILAYADGQHSATDIAELTGFPVDEVAILVEELEEHRLVIRGHQTKRFMLNR
jgi:aminopeptidase-like protein